jgi:hypothetical protein
VVSRIPRIPRITNVDSIRWSTKNGPPGIFQAGRFGFQSYFRVSYFRVSYFRVSY